MTMKYIGIDPGKSGGLAILDDHGAIAELTKTPPTLRGLCITMERWSGDVFVMVEKVGGFMATSKDGSKFNPASAHTMFEFGRTFGHLESLLIALQIPHEFVMPAVWQKGVGIERKRENENRSQWKGRLRSFSQELYPDADTTLATADALLIAHYCYKTKGTVR